MTPRDRYRPRARPRLPIRFDILAPGPENADFPNFTRLGITREAHMFCRWTDLWATAILLFAGAVAWSADERQPVPDEQTQTAKEAVVKEILGKELEGANNDAARVALAERLLKLADESKDDPGVQYVLFERVRNLGIQTGDCELIVHSVDRQAAVFQVDGLKLKASGFFRADKLPLKPEPRKALTEAMLALTIEAAGAGERFDIAEPLSDAALVSARKTRDKALLDRCMYEVKRVREAKTRFGELEKTKATLAATPTDPEANLALGQWLALYREEWDEALPYLALGSDTALAAAAKKELNKPADTATRVATGDAWWDAAEARTGTEQSILKRRAGKWYSEATAEIVGLSKVRIEKRLKESEQLAAAASGKPAAKTTAAKTTADKPADKPSSREKPGKVFPGMLGRVLVNKADAGAAVLYLPGKSITHAKVVDPLKSAGAAIEINLVGVIALAKPAELKMRHAGGSPSRGVCWLYVDGREVGAVGDDRTKDATYDVSLPAGNHTVSWKITGGELGSCLIDVWDAGTSEKVPIVHSQEMAAQQKQLGSKLELNFTE